MVRKIREAQEAARPAALRRQWALEDEARQRRREAEEVARQEREEAVRQQEHAEHQAATRWWQELSATQREELFTAVRDRLQGAEPGPTRRRTGSRPELDEQPTRGHAHRLPDEVPVFVRNAREARQLTDTGAITAERVIAFDLPLRHCRSKCVHLAPAARMVRRRS
ncbi:hypothetical protein ACQPZF_20480 [Actinosynnema sp. CS-041913]|uniref:hypothetical protein n=1 Tax=Actinosynnema sp. CS-041913 TaxID=3239917 RepID=UPI003D8E5D65